MSFINLKSLNSGSAGTSTSTNYVKVLANTHHLNLASVDTITDSATGAQIQALRLNFGAELNEDILVKAFYASATAPTVSGTGNGTMSVPVINQGTSTVAETWTITATSATNFTVVGSVSGAKAAATVGTPYDNGLISFTITAGGTAFVASDVFSVPVLSTMTKLQSFMRINDLTGTPAFQAIPMNARGLVKYTRLVNGSDSVASYLNSGKIILVKDNGSAGTTVVLEGADNPDLVSSQLIATWATALGARDLETTVSENIVDGFFATAAIEDSLSTTGTTQSGATAMLSTRNVHRFTTVGSAGGAATLPAAVVGAAHFVMNSAASNSMQVFGLGTDTINDVAAATGVAQAAGKGALYVCVSAGKWYRSLGA